MDSLPNEITIIILNFITDTKTYKNCRIVCKLWNSILHMEKYLIIIN